MTDPAPLTDEELAAIEARANRAYFVRADWQEEAGRSLVTVDMFRAFEDVSRLVATLRASRAEERWTADQIIDAGHRLAWPDHDIALLVAMLQEPA